MSEKEGLPAQRQAHSYSFEEPPVPMGCIRRTRFVGGWLSAASEVPLHGGQVLSRCFPASLRFASSVRPNRALSDTAVRSNKLFEHYYTIGEFKKEVQTIRSDAPQSEICLLANGVPKGTTVQIIFRAA